LLAWSVVALMARIQMRKTILLSQSKEERERERERERKGFSTDEGDLLEREREREEGRE
jgi:hypothetical protein